MNDWSMTDWSVVWIIAGTVLFMPIGIGVILAFRDYQERRPFRNRRKKD